MKKEILVGYIPGQIFGYKRGQYKAYFTFELQEKEPGLMFFMSGYVKSTNGRTEIMAGQCIEEIA